jgi:hypothetical protein
MNFLKLLDIVLVVLAFGLSTVFTVQEEQRVSLAQFFSPRAKVSAFVIFGLALFLCHLVLCVCGLYRPMRRSSRRAQPAHLILYLKKVT